jgi:outer membrane immunogenic protein
MKTLFTLTIAFFAAAFLAESSYAGPERIESKESKIVQPIVEKPCNWTGFYIGVQGGYGWGDLTWTQIDEIDETSFDESLLAKHDHGGFFVGGEQGYNYQIGWLVLGAEGDFSYSDVNDQSSADGLGGPGPSKLETGTNWEGSIGGRAGVAFKRFLFFAKGGVSFAHLEYSWFRVDTDSGEAPHTETASADEVRIAPMVGGGVEYMINCHWSVKVEYKHLFLGKDHFSGTSVDTLTGETPEFAELETYKSKANRNETEFGLNYKF